MTELGEKMKNAYSYRLYLKEKLRDPAQAADYLLEHMLEDGQSNYKMLETALCDIAEANGVVPQLRELLDIADE
jgi:DNA-binding phage protein